MFRFLNKIRAQYIEQEIITVDDGVERFHDECHGKVIYIIMLIIIQAEKIIIITIILKLCAITFVFGYEVIVVFDSRRITKASICQTIQQLTNNSTSVIFLLLIDIAQKCQYCIEIILIAINDKLHLVVPYRITNLLKGFFKKCICLLIFPQQNMTFYCITDLYKSLKLLFISTKTCNHPN